MSGRWDTRREVRYHGELRSIEEWAKIHNLSPRRVLRRLQRGWAIKPALTTPVDEAEGV